MAKLITITDDKYVKFIAWDDVYHSIIHIIYFFKEMEGFEIEIIKKRFKKIDGSNFSAPLSVDGLKKIQGVLKAFKH